MSDSKQTSHTQQTESILENVVNTILGSDRAGHNLHTVNVEDSHGNTGTGTGSSSSEARRNAEADLRHNR